MSCDSDVVKWSCKMRESRVITIWERVIAHVAVGVIGEEQTLIKV